MKACLSSLWRQWPCGVREPWKRKTHNRALKREEIDKIKNGQAPTSHGLVAYWDTTDGYTDQGIGDAVTDVGPFHLHAKGYNRPVRAQTGWNWGGRNDCFRLAPHEYGGIEFHADALIDCNWKVTQILDVPEDLRSGAYGMRLRAGDGATLNVIAFRAAGQKLGAALLNNRGRPVHAAGSLAVDRWNGEERVLCVRRAR